MISREKSIPYENLGKSVVGYLINCALDKKNQIKIAAVQEKLGSQFPGFFWFPAGSELHITVLDWIAPLVDYGRDKDEIFGEIFNNYDALFEVIIEKMKPFEIEFDQMIAYNNSLIVTGRDNGSFAKIRSQFVKKSGLDPRTKKPAGIIHSTIARYNKSENLEKISDFLKTLEISFRQKISNFRLVRETKIPMLEYKTIKQYRLG